LPKDLDGQLSGHADLVVRVDAQGPYTTGSGKGVIDNTRLNDTTIGSLPLLLRAEGKRFRFIPRLFLGRSQTPRQAGPNLFSSFSHLFVDRRLSERAK
jgi:hypothetical protein